MSNEKIGAMHWMYQQIMNDANISPAFKEALPVDLGWKHRENYVPRVCLTDGSDCGHAYCPKAEIDETLNVDGQTFAEACQQMNQALRLLEEDYLRRMAMRSIESDVDALDELSNEAFADACDGREEYIEPDDSRYEN